MRPGTKTTGRNFYPRSPCGERLRFLNVWLAFKTFLSTLSLRRATAEADFDLGAHGISIHALLAESDHGRGPALHGEGDFYPRSPCGERLKTDIDTDNEFAISIHALLAESDDAL